MACDAAPLGRAFHGVPKRYASWMAQHDAVESESELNSSLYLLLPDRYGNGSYVGRLGPLMTKWARGEPASIGIAGASVSAGSGLDQRSDVWHAVLASAIDQIWPHSRNVWTCGAKPATTAAFAALCYDSILKKPLDLLLVEYSWNTDIGSEMAALVGTALGRGTAVMAVDYQHAVRQQAWQSCAMDVSTARLLHRAAGTTVDGRACYPGAMFNNPGRVKHWHVFAADTWPFHGFYIPIVSQGHLNSWRKMGRNESLRIAPQWFIPDGTHPGVKGHMQIARLLVHALFRAHERLASVGCDASDRAWPRVPAVARGRFCDMGDGLSSLGLETESEAGWRWGVRSSRGLKKPGFQTSTPGSVLRLRLNRSDANVEGMTSSGADNHRQLFVGFLRSYEGMGTARITCSGGCSCDPIELDGHDATRQVSLEVVSPPIIVRIADMNSCALQAEALRATRSASNTFKITFLAWAATSDSPFGSTSGLDSSRVGAYMHR